MSDVTNDSREPLRFENGIIVHVLPQVRVYDTDIILSGSWRQYLALNERRGLITATRPNGIISFLHFGTFNRWTGTFKYAVWNSSINNNLNFLSQLR
jgi:hypothetical protein